MKPRLTHSRCTISVAGKLGGKSFSEHHLTPIKENEVRASHAKLLDSPLPPLCASFQEEGHIEVTNEKSVTMTMERASPTSEGWDDVARSYDVSIVANKLS